MQKRFSFRYVIYLVVFLGASCILSTPLYSQPKRNDYRKIVKNATFYGVVYDRAKVVRADRPAYMFRNAFVKSNEALQADFEKLGKAIKSSFHIQLDSVAVSFANDANKSIGELGLLAYGDNTEKGDYSELHNHLESLGIPKTEGYGIIIFATLISYKKNIIKYDLVFFDRNNMQILAFSDTESSSLTSDILKSLVAGVYTAIRTY